MAEGVPRFINPPRYTMATLQHPNLPPMPRGPPPLTPSTTSTSTSSNSSSPTVHRMGIPEKLADLTNSPNTVAAGVGEVLQALAAVTNAPNSKPIMVEFGNRVMAVGRSRMMTMNGRNAFLYMKSKFGLLNASTAFFLEATFEGNEDRYVEIDLDSWEELVVYMHKLRIIS
ncbi:hypothetical protein CPB83DRAFT_857552 [Crepidotus variabilis]|uniref:Uncharacterized protein n=1 Tax=Crepidotus variabilis TaxID=179855 RepID=A0A9P6ECN3_9AGAR|nr:hypothetical protein CPB83DRAFT_857552 [Crepidotus variabilis]